MSVNLHIPRRVLIGLRFRGKELRQGISERIETFTVMGRGSTSPIQFIPQKEGEV